jgi:hypothetical protein
MHRARRRDASMNPSSASWLEREAITMRVPVSSWSLFIIMTFGLIVLLVGQRPELQKSEEGPGPGKAVRVVGHSVTWGAAAALTGRMIRSARSSLEAEAGQREQPPRTSAEPDEPTA